MVGGTGVAGKGVVAGGWLVFPALLVTTFPVLLSAAGGAFPVLSGFSGSEPVPRMKERTPNMRVNPATIAIPFFPAIPNFS